MEVLSQVRAFGGTQGVYSHTSEATGTQMTFAVFVPDHQPGARLPVLTYLSGLTCTHANVMEKGEYRAACAKHGIIFVAPTPRRAARMCPMPATNMILAKVRAFMSMPPVRHGLKITACAVISRANCRA